MKNKSKGCINFAHCKVEEETWKEQFRAIEGKKEAKVFKIS